MPSPGSTPHQTRETRSTLGDHSPIQRRGFGSLPQTPSAEVHGGVPSYYALIGRSMRFGIESVEITLLPGRVRQR